MRTVTVVNARDFSDTPGPRHISEGEFSGEKFRKEVLLPAFRKVEAEDGELHVDLDGTEGYATSFLEEAFGGLAREVGSAELLARLTIKSDDEPYLREQVKGYIVEAGGRRNRQ